MVLHKVTPGTMFYSTYVYFFFPPALSHRSPFYPIPQTGHYYQIKNYILIYHAMIGTVLLLLYSCLVMPGCFVISWTIAHQPPLSTGFSREDYSSGLPFPSAGDLPNPGIKPESPAFAGSFFTSDPPGKLC